MTKEELIEAGKRLAENDPTIKVATAIVVLRRKVAELDKVICETFKE